MAKGISQSIYEFDGFRLDRDRLMLYRGEAEVSLPPKAVETLAILVGAKGEIIGKDDLIEELWTDSVVEESNLSQYLYLLRKTLGKKPDGTPYIETLRRRGYRFTADVRVVTAPAKALAAVETPIVRGERRAVERRGNVLAVVDWNPEEHPEPEAEPAVAPAPPPHYDRWAWITGAAVIVAVIALSTTAFYLSGYQAVVADDIPREQNVTRLTNGIEVLAATISPDGKYFVYHEPDGKLNRIWLQQTGHGTRHEIVPASHRVPLTMTFTPDGQYIYFLASDTVGDSLSTLYRVPTLGGPVTPILSGTQSGVSFSPDGREMVFYRDDASGPRFVIKASDGSGEERLLRAATKGFGNAAWSPDGNSIVAAMRVDREGSSGIGCRLTAIQAETGELREFSQDVWTGCARIEWAPDGRGIYMIGTRLNEHTTTRRDQLFYISYPQGKSRKITAEGNRHQWSSLGVTADGSVFVVPFNRSSQIWSMDASGDAASARQITTGQADGRSGIAPLADGRVAYIARIGERLNVFVMNADGSEQRQLTDGDLSIEELRSGGDGRHLSYSGYAGGPRPHLFLMNADGSEPRPITGGVTQEVDSSISRDGKWIAYDSVTFNGDRIELSLWKQSLETGERISLNRDDCQMPHFSPDDKYVSCVRAQKDVLILSAADGTLINTIRLPQIVTINNSINFGARWTPDSRSIVYVVNEKGISNLWTHPIGGGAPKQLTNFTNGSIYHFAYSLDGTRLFLARGNQIRDAVLIKENGR